MIKRILHSSWLALVLLFIYLPVLILAVYSFTDTATIGTRAIFPCKIMNTIHHTGELRGMIGGGHSCWLSDLPWWQQFLGTIGAIGAFYCKKGPKQLIQFVNQIPVINADVVTGFSLCVLMIVVLGMDKETLSVDSWIMWYWKRV